MASEPPDNSTKANPIIIDNNYIASYGIRRLVQDLGKTGWCVTSWSFINSFPCCELISLCACVPMHPPGIEPVTRDPNIVIFCTWPTSITLIRGLILLIVFLLWVLFSLSLSILFDAFFLKETIIEQSLYLVEWKEAYRICNGNRKPLSIEG